MKAKRTSKGASKRKKFFDMPKTIILLITCVFVLLTLYLHAVTTLPPRKFSYYKQFSLKLHEQVQSIVNEAKQAKPEIETLDANDTNLMLAFYVYESMLEDLEWIAERENMYFLKMQSALNEDEEKEIARKEIACGVVLQYILMLNAAANQQIESYRQSSVELLIEEAKLRMESIKNTYLSEDLLESIASYSGLKIEEVKEEIKELMNEYLKLRKRKLDEAIKEGNPLKKFVEAEKMLMLAGSFQ